MEQIKGQSLGSFEDIMLDKLDKIIKVIEGGNINMNTTREYRVVFKTDDNRIEESLPFTVATRCDKEECIEVAKKKINMFKDNTEKWDDEKKEWIPRFKITILRIELA